MVELRSPDADAAKREAEYWFAANGISASGLCNLPVVFYLNSDIAELYRSMGKRFDPVPTDC